MTKIQQAYWIASELRKKYRAGKLSPSQIKALKNINFDFEANMVEENKNKLFEMAREGKPRPPKDTKIGRALCNYTDKRGSCFDPVFNADIRAIATSWFVPRTGRAAINKLKIFEMVKNGEPKPSQKTCIGRALKNYTSKNGDCYDPVFDAEIRRLAPHWFRKVKKA